MCPRRMATAVPSSRQAVGVWGGEVEWLEFNFLLVVDRKASSGCMLLVSLRNGWQAACTAALDRPSHPATQPPSHPPSC